MITYDGIIFSLRSSMGGIAVYFRELIRLTKAAGIPMSVLVHEPRLDARELACEGAPVMFRPPRMLERYRRLRGIRPGILHSSYYRTTRDPQVRNAISAYDFTYEKFGSPLSRLGHSTQKNAAIRRADVVFCISENTRRDLLEFLPDVDPQKVFVTPLAASPHFRPLPAPEVAPQVPYVLFVSGRTTYKNFDAVVKAVQAMPGVSLLCVGGGAFTPAERDALEKALPGRHAHAGHVGGERLNEIYNQALCLAYPSSYEGFGIPPLEAMSAGCPFVALRTSSIPEVAGDAGILLEEPHPDSLAAAIDACRQPARRAELIARGLRRAAQFSWEKTAQNTFAIYRQLGLVAA